jgi:hypothetical protein
MSRGPGFKGSLINVDLRGDPNIDHLNIDKSPRLHARVIAEVSAIVGSHRMEQPTAAVKPVPAELKTGAVGGGETKSAQPATESAKASEPASDVTTGTAKPLADGGTPVIAAPEKRGPAAASAQPSSVSAKPTNLPQ